MTREQAFAVKAAKIVKEYCGNHVCDECPFNHPDYGCVICGPLPEEWKVDEL